MIYNRYQQQFNDLYLRKFQNSLGYKYVNMLQSENLYNTGFMRLSIVNYSDKTPVTNATITIYVTDGQQRDVPVMHLITTINPIRIELPMANELGTLIVGREYSFSTYNLRVDAFGFFARNISNIRLFPNTTIDFEIDLVPISYLEAQPLIEERFDTPPHPRDIINGE